MNKRSILFPLALVLVLGTAGSSEAGETLYRFDPVTQTSRPIVFPQTYEGYLTFHNFCKSCHSKDNSVGAPFLHTESKTRRGWNRVFLTHYPQCAKDGTWDKLSEDDLLKLHDYLFSEAKDTYNPYGTSGAC